MSLRDHPFRIYYGPADDPLANFYIPVLSASLRYDRSGLFQSPLHWQSRRRGSHVKGRFVPARGGGAGEHAAGVL